MDFVDVNADLYSILEYILKQNNEGKCINEGYVKINSITPHNPVTLTTTGYKNFNAADDSVLISIYSCFR